MRLSSSVLVLLCSCICVSVIKIQAHLIPQHYDLHLRIEPLNRTLSGVVRCRIFIENKTESIELFTDQSTVIKNISIQPYELK